MIGTIEGSRKEAETMTKEQLENELKSLQMKKSNLAVGNIFSGENSDKIRQINEEIDIVKSKLFEQSEKCEKCGGNVTVERVAPSKFSVECDECGYKVTPQ